MYDHHLIEEGGYQISYESPTGELWTIHTPDRAMNKHRRVALLEGGFKGGVVGATVKEVESVNRFGARVTGVKYPSFDGSLGVAVFDQPAKPSWTFRQWRQSWSHDRDGVLRVVARDGGNYWTPVRQTDVEPPGFDPKVRPVIEDEVKFTSLAGCWFGASFRKTGTAQFAPGGDMPAKVRLWWDGSATSVTFPAGNTLSFSATGKGRWINLDRGFMGQVTDADGNVDTAIWSALRGKLSGISLKPHELVTFVLGVGMELEVTPRYLHPWR